MKVKPLKTGLVENLKGFEGGIINFLNLGRKGSDKMKIIYKFSCFVEN